MLCHQNFSFRPTVDTRPFLNGPGNKAICNCTRGEREGGAWKWGLPFLHEIAVHFEVHLPPHPLPSWQHGRTWASEGLRVNSGSNFWMGQRTRLSATVPGGTWKWGLLSHAEKGSHYIHNLWLAEPPQRSCLIATRDCSQASLSGSSGSTALIHSTIIYDCQQLWQNTRSCGV